jgi:hypothetical protein
MDIQSIDNAYAQLQQEAGQTSQKVQALASKLQADAQSGDQNAREWMLDLREIALAVQAEENQVAALLQAMHGFAVSNLQQPQYAAPPPGYAPQPPRVPAAAARLPDATAGLRVSAPGRQPAFGLSQ